MPFTGLTFLLLFLPLFFLLYAFVPAKRRAAVLLLAGLVFVGWGGPLLLLFPAALTLIVWISGLTLRQLQTSPHRLPVLLLGIFLCLLPLLTLRLTPALQPADGALLPLFLPPLGLSFCTLEAVAYLLQVYRGELRAEARPDRLAGWLFLFAKLPAGPVTDYKTLRPALLAPAVTPDGLYGGLSVFLRGLSKKLILSDPMRLVWAEIGALPVGAVPVLTAWVGFFAFLFFLYYALSGYADMAAGLGQMLGIPLPVNFRHPFWSKSICEFWSRCFYTVTDWFRRQVYTPVAARLPRWMAVPAATLAALAAIWLWCGTASSYLLFAVLTELLLLVEREFLAARLPRWRPVLRWGYTMLLTLPGLLLLAFPDAAASGRFLFALFGGTSGGFFGSQGLYLLYSNGVFFLFCLLGVTSLPRRFAFWLGTRAPSLYRLLKAAGSVLLLLCCLSALTGTVLPLRVL